MATVTLTSAQTPAAKPQPTSEQSALPGGDRAYGPLWREYASGPEMKRLYPERARKLNVAGRVMIRCLLHADGVLSDCVVKDEWPAGFGFGGSALKAAALFKADMIAPANARNVGELTSLVLMWFPPDRVRLTVETAHVKAAPIVLTAPSPAYPAEARAQGAQGDVIMRGRIGFNGALLESSLATSSRSPALDDAARAAFGRWTFAPGLGQDNAAMATVVTARVSFSRDSLETLGDKSCADVNVDRNWFRAAFPERAAVDMQLYALTYRKLVPAALEDPHAGMALARRLPAAYESTLAACAANGKAGYLTTLLARAH